jgi:RNA polymerase sigma-70 factor (ECF subfamily)
MKLHGETDDPDVWQAALLRAHASWPVEWVPAADFIEYLRARVPPDREVQDAVPALAAADLYLACACARRIAAAVERFARTILVEVDAHVARFDRSPAFADDVRQALAAKLLVAPAGEIPKIAEYAGSAPLSAWVRVAAIRVALNLRRGKAGELEHADDEALAERAGREDVELEVIRRRYGAAFETALAQALELLPARDRTLLRLRLVEGVEVDRIATMYRVHRATVRRWLADGRERLITETRHLLQANLGIASAELDSLAGLIRSQLHVSLAQLLRDPS